MTKSVLIALSLSLALACEGEPEAAQPAPAPEVEEQPEVRTSAPVAAAQPGPAVAGAAPRPLAVNQPAVSLPVPMPPSFELAIEEAGEYRIDVTASGEANPLMHLYLGETLVEEDDDGGDGDDARVVRFLAPGAYSIRVSEHDARPFTASVHAERLEPLEPAATITIGPAVDVVFPMNPELRRAENDRDASRAVALRVARAGDYACVARMDNGRIARMQLIQNGAVLAADEQRFTELAASVSLRLAPGTYEIRVWDAEYRGDMRATVMCDPAE